MPHIRNYFLQLTRKIFHVIIIAQLTSYFVHLNLPYLTSFQLQGGTMPSVISRFRWLTRAIIVLPLSILFVLSSTMLALANVALTRLSTDPYTNSTSQHATQVEPDTFSFGTTIVSAFQSGRFTDGGSSNIGWATSTDSGSTWTH